MKAVVVSDTSVLINFLKIDRLDLLRECSLKFLITNHVAAEISESFPKQLQRFQRGVEEGIFEEVEVVEDAEVECFLML